VGGAFRHIIAIADQRMVGFASGSSRRLSNLM
jgi:hypothetical protein